MKHSEVAYSKIRKMIALTELRPGEEIIVSELMKQLSLGKTPIREALNRLSYEGFIKVMPRKGMLVTHLSVDDLNELRALRVYFVKFVSEQIIAHTCGEDIERLRGIQDKLKGKNETFMNAIEADLEFHEVTYELCRNKYAERMLKINLYLSIRLMVVQKPLNVTVKSVIKNYEQLIDGIHSRDVSTLEAFFLNHINEEMERT